MEIKNQKFQKLCDEYDSTYKECEKLIREKGFSKEKYEVASNLQNKLAELKDIINSFATRMFDDTQAYQSYHSYDRGDVVDFANKAINEGWKLVSIAYSSREIEYFAVFENINYKHLNT